MDDNKKSVGLFAKLSKLFKGGPLIKKKIKTSDTTIAMPDKSSSAMLLFQKSQSPTYARITGNAFNMSERLMKYQDFVDMESMPEISSALDIYADEACSSDAKGKMLHIFSEDHKKLEILQNLFYNKLNIEFNARLWARNTAKYGDTFLYLDISPEMGVINCFPVPVNEIEREENYDKNDPFAFRFKWHTLNKVVEDWEMVHMRLLGNDLFLPYGSSLIEPARRIWRQLVLIEDAMLVYRITRAPERRIFYIDIGNIPPDEVDAYIEEQNRKLRMNQVIDSTSSKVDVRYNPMSISEDYVIPVRGSESGTKIDTLAGGQNTAAVEDVAYIQKKLISALKVPAAYLGYNDMLGSKATLAQMDIRFSRTVNMLQKTMVAELNKIAIIELYCHGYSEEDLTDFNLSFTNPSAIAVQQKLEIWRAKFEIAGSVPEGFASKKFVRKEIWDLTDEQINELDEDRLKEKMADAMIENATGIEQESAGGGGGGGGGSLLGGGGGDLDIGGEELGGEDMGDIGEVPEDLGGGEEEVATSGEENAEDDHDEDEKELLTSSDLFDPSEHDFPIRMSSDNLKKKIKPTQLQKYNYNNSRRRTHGSSQTHMPNFNSMVSNKSDFKNPFDQSWIKSVVSNPLGESSKRRFVNLPSDISSMLNRLSEKLNIKKQDKMLTEVYDIDLEEDI